MGLKALLVIAGVLLLGTSVHNSVTFLVALVILTGVGVLAHSCHRAFPLIHPVRRDDR